MDSSHRFGEISYLSRQAANDAGQKASVPAFLRCLFLCRFAAGGNQFRKRFLFISCPELIVPRRFLNRPEHSRIPCKRALCGRTGLQPILAAFQQSAAFLAVQQNKGCPLRMVGFRLNTLDAPVVRQCDIASPLDALEFTVKAGAAGIQTFDKSTLIRILGSGL